MRIDIDKDEFKTALTVYEFAEKVIFGKRGKTKMVCGI